MTLKDEAAEVIVQVSMLTQVNASLLVLPPCTY